MSDPNDWNQQIIAEFRANDGVVGGMFEGKPLLLLHHTGAKSGTSYVTPLMYREEGNALAIFASKGGAPDNPDWFHNLAANSKVEVELGTTTETRTARMAEGDERDQIWERQKAEFPQFAEYEASTDRTIPVIVLEPA